jgi:hypothetical protein
MVGVQSEGLVQCPNLHDRAKIPRTGEEPLLPETEGVDDNVRGKRQSLLLTTVFANQLLLVDEVMRATLVLLPSVGF